MTRATGMCLAVLAALTIATAARGQPTVVGWHERIVVTASLPGSTPADRAVGQRLETTVVSFTFNEQPLEEAMEFLATLGKVNIVIDRRKVAAGKTLTLKLADVSLRTALQLATEQVALRWAVRDGVVFISDEEGVRADPVTVVYDVGDLLAVAPDFEGPQIELGAIGTRTGDGNSNPEVPWLADPSRPGQPQREPEKSREELLQELVELVRQTIEPGSWQTE